MEFSLSLYFLTAYLNYLMETRHYPSLNGTQPLRHQGNWNQYIGYGRMRAYQSSYISSAANSHIEDSGRYGHRHRTLCRRGKVYDLVLHRHIKGSGRQSPEHA